MVQEMLKGRQESSQLGPEAGAEATGRGSELGGGSIRPLDVRSSAAVPDSPVRRPVRPH